MGTFLKRILFQFKINALLCVCWATKKRIQCFLIILMWKKPHVYFIIIGLVFFIAVGKFQYYVQLYMQTTNWFCSFSSRNVQIHTWKLYKYLKYVLTRTNSSSYRAQTFFKQIKIEHYVMPNDSFLILFTALFLHLISPWHGRFRSNLIICWTIQYSSMEKI